jgi:hypothetical protein
MQWCLPHAHAPKYEYVIIWIYIYLYLHKPAQNINIYTPICLSIYLSIYLTIYISVYIYLSIYICLSISIYFFFYILLIYLFIWECQCAAIMADWEHPYSSKSLQQNLSRLDWCSILGGSWDVFTTPSCF